MKHIKEIMAGEKPRDDKISKTEDIIYAECEKRNENVRRQFKIGKYTADFFFQDRNLVLEIDGKHWHKGKYEWERDRSRDRFMLARGYCIVRVDAEMAYKNPSGIIQAITHLTKPTMYFIESDNALRAIYNLKLADFAI